MRQHLTPLIIIALVTACSVQTGPEDTVDLPAGETLIVPPPEGWARVYALNREATRIVEYLPAGETDSNWTARLSFESFMANDDLDPIDVLLLEAIQDQERCPNLSHYNVFSGLENAYSTSVRLYQCGNFDERGKGRIKMIKSIAGNEYLYLIRFVARTDGFERTPPTSFQHTIASWSDYLSHISLCDVTHSDHPCPESPTTP